jgi:hypothetical protein
MTPEPTELTKLHDELKSARMIALLTRNGNKMLREALERIIAAKTAVLDPRSPIENLARCGELLNAIEAAHDLLTSVPKAMEPPQPPAVVPDDGTCRHCAEPTAPKSVFCYKHRLEAFNAGTCWRCGDQPRFGRSRYCVRCKNDAVWKDTQRQSEHWTSQEILDEEKRKAKPSKLKGRTGPTLPDII